MTIPATIPLQMYDSAAPARIATVFARVAVYVDGPFAWPQEQVARFRHVIRISVTGDPAQAAHARCVDVERFDATPQDARGFIIERIRLGHSDATVYCSRAALPAVEEACEGLSFRRWVADWTGMAHEVPGCWATQYQTVPGQFDVSAVYGKPDFSRP